MNTAFRGRAASQSRPVVSAAVAERIREWHEAVLRAGERHRGSEQRFAYLGMTLIVPPGVQQVTGVSHILGEALLAEVREGDRVLDIGTGSGVNAILAASQGDHVVAVDVSPEALDAARENVERVGMADQVEVRRSDLFSDVVGQFDIIVYEPRVRWFSPHDGTEIDVADDRVRAVMAWMRLAGGYLTLRGRILFFVGPSADVVHLKQLATEETVTMEPVAQEALIKEGRSIDYFAYRLTPGLLTETP